MSALSRMPIFTRPVRAGRSKPAPVDDLKTLRPQLSTVADNRLTESAPRSDNDARSENARKWLAAGSLDRDADDIAATVNRLVSALDSRDWMTSPHTPSKPLRAAAGPTEPAASRATTDDLSFAEGVDFREVARRIAEFRQARPDPANGDARGARRARADTPSPSAAAPAMQDDWTEYPHAVAASEAAGDWSQTGSTHLEPLTSDDWPLPPAADVGSQDAAPSSGERPAAGESSLRQRLAALRARSVHEAAPAPEAPPEPVAPARTPLDSSDAFAKAMLAQFDDDNWQDAEGDAESAEALDVPAVSDETAVHPLPDEEPLAELPEMTAGFEPDAADEEVESWAAGAWAEDVSNESLLAALDAHLADAEADDAAPMAPEINLSEDEDNPAPAEDQHPIVEETDAAADRRIALDTAQRAEDIATRTGDRIEDLVDRLGRIEGQDLTGRFTALADRFDRIDARLTEIAVPAPQPDFAPVTAPIKALEARVARLEATATDQHAALSAMVSSVADRVAVTPEIATRLVAIEHHMQELSRRVEAHEVNLRAMKALAASLDRLEARLAAPRAPAPAVTVPSAPRHPAAEAPHRAGAPVPSRAPAAAGQPATQGHAMSEREAILERYRRQSRVRSEG